MTKNRTLTRELFNYCNTNTEREYLTEVLALGSNNKAAQALEVNRRTVDRTINRIVDRAQSEGLVVDTDPKILVMDIETAPMQSYLWSLFKPVFGHNMMVDTSYILSWAAKWLGEEEIYADGICFNDDYAAGDENDKRMLQNIYDLLDEADFVVAHNGDKFDIKRLNTRFLLNGMTPPSPYKSIDTLKIAKRNFAFDTNRLDFILQNLLGREKEDSGGFETWRGCMNGDMDAWDTLIHYNKQDVLDLEDIYMIMRPWDGLHPSAATNGGTRGIATCTVCSSENVSLQPEKYYSTGVSRFPLWKCDDCGTYMRGRKSVVPPEHRPNLLVNVK